LRVRELMAAEIMSALMQEMFFERDRKRFAELVAEEFFYLGDFLFG